MKRWIAMVVIIALAGATAGYVVDAPFAPHAAPPSRPTFAMFDQAAAAMLALLGPIGAIAAPLVTGAVLCGLLLLLNGARPVPVASGPVWRPEFRATDQGLLRPNEARAGESEAPDTEGPPPGPLALIRKARSRSRDWFDDPSWLGGLPKLAGIPWPRDENGAPLPFAAQIDLADIAAACPEAPLPAAGSLAFFLGDGAVVPVPPGAHEFTAPPAAPRDGNGLPASNTARPFQDFFPFWPVEPVAVALPEDLRDGDEPGDEEAVERAMTDWLARRYPLRDGALTVPEPVTRIWWHGARHLAERLHVALAEASRLIDKRMIRTSDARADIEMLQSDPATTPLRLEAAERAFEREEAKLANIRAQHAALSQVVPAMDGFVDDRDLWSPLSQDEFAVIEDVLTHLGRDCPDLVRRHLPQSMAEIAALSLRAMVSGPPEALAQVPDSELARINAAFRLANLHQHQMFGPSGGLARAGHDDHRGEILLLQLARDDMMDWDWALYQFWIRPEDLARRRWDRVALTFQSG